MELDALIRARTERGDRARPVEIADLAFDTRRVTKGALYFCVPGARVDGHDFAWEAVERGAVALVVERPLDVVVPQVVVPDVRAAMAVAADAFFGEPTRELEVAGVTGTNGKTTTAFLLQSMLDSAGRPAGLVGTIEWIVGGERRPAPFTTPEAIDLQRLFREMLDNGDRSAVEASSHGSALRRLDRVRFDALVFTNLSQDHLDCIERWRTTSRRSGTSSRAATAGRRERGRRVGRQACGRARRCPPGSAGHVRHGRRCRDPPESLELSPSGSRFRAAGIEIETRLRGLFNVENVLGAVAAGLLLDLDEDAIATGIARVSDVPGRFEAVDRGQPFTVVVDYAHTPDSLETVLARRAGSRTVVSSLSSEPGETATVESGR